MYCFTKKGLNSLQLGNPQCFKLTTKYARLSLKTRSANEGKSTSATATSSSPDADDCDYNIGNYCSIDEMGKRVNERTIGEKEQDFLAALSSFYFEGKSIMSDEEFENLKDELIWAGSKVPILDSTEKKFLEASLAYAKGKPIISDEEYDDLKLKLRQSNSIAAAQGPRCSIRSKKMYSDCNPDYLRTTLLNLPGAMLVLGVVFTIDNFSGFSITNLVTLPPPYGIALLWGLLLPTSYVISTALTNIGFKDGVILKGSCPNCGSDNFTYFGDILTVSGNRGQNVVDCPQCNASLTFDEYKRILVVSETPEDKAEKSAAAAAKKAASAAKKKAAQKA